MKKESNTFISSVRVDIRDIATIASFLANEGEFVETKARVASTAVRILARHIPKRFHIGEYLKAVQALSRLGYDPSRVKGTKYYSALEGKIGEEAGFSSLVEKAIEGREEAERFYVDDNKSSSTIEKTALNSILAPTENEPEAEAPQLKIRTIDDEKKDVSKLRTAIGNFSDAPVLEENTGRADQPLQ